MWMWKCTRTDSLISNISNTQPWAEHLISLYWVTSAWAQELFFSGRWREAVGPWAECSSYTELLDIIRNHNYWSFWKQQMELSSSCQGFGASWYSKPGMTRQKHYQHNIQFTVEMLCKSVFVYGADDYNSWHGWSIMEKQKCSVQLQVYISTRLMQSVIYGSSFLPCTE